MSNHPNIEMLEIVARGLGALCDEVVFVGGAVTAFYIRDPAATEIRPTTDVDCVIKIATTQDYHQLEARLRDLGFENDRKLICRWIYQGVQVDVMTTEGTATGFTNKWYLDGMNERESMTLPSGKAISVFSLWYFIATKFEAFKGRGNGSYRESHDIEDIVTVLDGCGDENVFSKIPEKLDQYLKKVISKFRKSSEFDESLYAHMSRTGNMQVRVQRLIDVIQQYCDV
jgi:hypothetical protein